MTLRGLVSFCGDSPRRFAVTQVEIVPHFRITDVHNMERQKRALILANRHRDIHIDFSIQFLIPDLPTRRATLRNQRVYKRMNSMVYWLAHLSILFALPYRLWISSVTETATIPIIKQFTCGDLSPEEEEEKKMFECVNSCGFRSSYSQVQTHERACTFAKSSRKSKVGAREEPEGEGGSGRAYSVDNGDRAVAQGGPSPSKAAPYSPRPPSPQPAPHHAKAQDANGRHPSSAKGSGGASRRTRVYGSSGNYESIPTYTKTTSGATTVVATSKTLPNNLKRPLPYAPTATLETHTPTLSHHQPQSAQAQYSMSPPWPHVSHAAHSPHAAKPYRGILYAVFV